MDIRSRVSLFIQLNSTCMHKSCTGFLTSVKLKAAATAVASDPHRGRTLSKTTGQYSTSELAKACYKMKLLLIFLDVVAATFALPNSANERHPLPYLLPLNAALHHSIPMRSNLARPFKQNFFKAGQVYLNNIFPSAINYGSTPGNN